MEKETCIFVINPFNLFDLPVGLEDLPIIIISEAEAFFSTVSPKMALDGLEILNKVLEVSDLIEMLEELIKKFGLTGRIRFKEYNGKIYIIFFDYIKNLRQSNITTILDSNIEKYIKSIPATYPFALKSISRNAMWQIAFTLIKVPVEIAIAILNDQKVDLKKVLLSNGFDLASGILVMALATGLSSIIVSSSAPVWISMVALIGASMAIQHGLEKSGIKKNMLEAYESNFESPKTFIPDKIHPEIDLKSLNRGRIW